MTRLQLLNLALALVIVFSGALANPAQSIAAEAQPGENGSSDLEDRGRVVSASLVVIAPERWGSRGIPRELFAVSADSAFWTGPCRPNPYSWLTTSVVCKDTLDFHVEVIEADGDLVEVLEFWRVPPAAYLFTLGDSGEVLEGEITLRFVYGEEVIWNAKLEYVSHE